MENAENIPSSPGETAGSEPLWESLRADNIDAFEEIFRLYYPILLRYGLKFNNYEDEVKDLIQNLFLQVWERRRFLGPTNSVKNYLLASLRRLIHKNAGFKTENIFSPNLDFHVELSAESKLIASQTEAQNIAIIKSAFDRLPARQKEAIYLKFYENQSFGEIAQMMGISLRATYKLIYKGLDNLHEQLQGKDIDVGYHLVLLFLVANQQTTSFSDFIVSSPFITN